jgi:hypothetical protein
VNGELNSLSRSQFNALLTNIALIIEHKQQGETRAAYGKQQLQTISQQLTEQFSKGFDVVNLRNMRQFYLTYPIRDALRSELSWSHYNLLSRLENPLICRVDKRQRIHHTR